MIIEVRVKPGSSCQEIREKEGKLIVNLKCRTENNKANKELINLLRKYYKKEVKIKSGLKSKVKRIEVE